MSPRCMLPRLALLLDRGLKRIGLPERAVIPLTMLAEEVIVSREA